MSTVVVVPPQILAPTEQRLYLRVGKLATEFQMTGPATRNELAVDDQHRADRHLSGLTGKLRLGERGTHDVLQIKPIQRAGLI